MKELKFSTNLKCGGCIATITPFMDQEKGIFNWSVDLTNSQRILTVETENISSNEIVAIMQKAGFQAQFIAE